MGFLRKRKKHNQHNRENTTLKRCVILDRDGVINYDSDEYIKSPDEWKPIEGSLDAIANLTKAGFTIFIATNQSAVGRGIISLDTLKSIHEKMLQEINNHGGIIAKIYFCPHTDDDNCSCRKPKTGMLQRIAEEYRIDLHEAILIGDSYRDIQAGISVGAKCVLVLTGQGKHALVTQKIPREVMVTDTLEDAAEEII